MKNRKMLVAALACAVAVMILVGYFIMANRGAPAIQAAAYLKESAEPESGSELKTLPDQTAGIPGMKLVADNAKLSLYYSSDTTEIAVLDKRQGQIWYSNPSNRNEDTIASPYEKEVLSSQVTVLFRDAIGTLDTYTNFGRSISNKQFTAESIENGIRITYTIGDMSLGIDALPKLINKTRLEEKVISKLDAATAKYVSARYYPSTSNPELMERLDGQIVKQLVLNKMLAAFATAGYTEEDLAQDNEENGVGGGGDSSKANFIIPLEYRLEQDSLVASIPLAQVKESGKYQIRSLEVLNFFGAAGKENEGYMVVPDGSGSIIHLNNGKVKEEQYVQKVYGADPNDNSWRRGQVSENAHMPVFGMKANDAAWFAVIEKGDAIASITADISGRKNSYNYVHSSFALRGEDELELYTGNKIQEIQLLNEEMYKGDIQVRYSFLARDKANYSGMAELYQSELIESGALKQLKEESDIPFYLDITGSIDKRKSFLGVPYQSIMSMTSFEEASQMADQLKTDGIERLQMRYLGWFGKGVNHKTPVKLSIDGVLGSKSEFIGLSKQLEESGGKLYPDVALQQMYHDDGGFTPFSDAARFVTKEQAELYPYNRALNRMDMSLGSYYLLSPSKLPYYVDTFMKSYAGLGVGGVSLRDLGGLLTSDYRDSRVIHRETSKQIVEEQLGKVSEGVDSVMLSDANAYAWPYAEHLINIPTSSSGFKITDEEIPFYQMVIHGFVNYSGIAINLSDEQDMRTQLLRSIELGASPHFSWTNQSSAKVKYTHFDTLFSTNYKDWYDGAVSMYKDTNEVLSQVNQAKMINHVKLQEGVIEVQYDNGKSVIVNYTDKAVSVNGQKVEAQNYWIGGERS